MFHIKSAINYHSKVWKKEGKEGEEKKEGLMEVKREEISSNYSGKGKRKKSLISQVIAGNLGWGCSHREVRLGSGRQLYLRLRGIRWWKQRLRGFPPYTCRRLRPLRGRRRSWVGWCRSTGRRPADVVRWRVPPPRPWTTWPSVSEWRDTVPWMSPFHPRRPRRTLEAAARTPALITPVSHMATFYTGNVYVSK